uniref:Uncharacterized protein n=1 Tax=Solanum tuberosum TaxID=4113 RepID=M1CMV1_SOLTU
MRIHELCLQLRNIKYLAKLHVWAINILEQSQSVLNLVQRVPNSVHLGTFISKKDLGLHLEPPMAFNMILGVNVLAGSL